jgi:hypothetical protein
MLLISEKKNYLVISDWILWIVQLQKKSLIAGGEGEIGWWHTHTPLAPHSTAVQQLAISLSLPQGLGVLPQFHFHGRSAIFYPANDPTPVAHPPSPTSLSIYFWRHHEKKQNIYFKLL